MFIPAFLALVAAALFGAATPISKTLLAGMNPFALAGLLYLGAALALAPAATRGDLFRKLRTLGGRNRLFVLGSIACGGIAGPVLLLFGLTLAKSGSVSLWLNLELAATAALGQLVFRDAMTRRSAAAAGGILLASVLLTLEGGLSGLLSGALVAGACLAWGLDNHFTALIDALKPAESTFVKGAAAGTANLAIGLMLAGKAGLTLPSSAGALALGALSYGLSIVLYISAAQGLGATRAQLFFSSSPLFGVALATVLLGETVSATQLAAAALMATSYAVLFGERHGHEHAHEASEHTHWHRHGEGHHLHDHGGAPPVAGHSHPHVHADTIHDHGHVSDIHHRHAHSDPSGGRDSAP